jgi:hypothetical protein
LKTSSESFLKSTALSSMKNMSGIDLDFVPPFQGFKNMFAWRFPRAHALGYYITPPSGLYNEEPY